MITREEHERVIDTFLMELQATAAALTDDQVRQLPGLADELSDAVADSRDPSLSNADLLARWCGAVDICVKAIWPDIVRESYALYVDMSGGRSERHPSRQKPEEGVGH